MLFLDENEAVPSAHWIDDGVACGSRELDGGGGADEGGHPHVFTTTPAVRAAALCSSRCRTTAARRSTHALNSSGLSPGLACP